MRKIERSVLVTGGAGYVGSCLVPKLLDAGHYVSVLDLYIYGKEIFQKYKFHPRLNEVQGDIRNLDTLESAIKNCDSVIHLACISNDPSFELNPSLGKSINYDSFLPLVSIAKKNNIERFIYASSSSVYGIKEECNVTEDLTLEPLTDYSKYKAMCEKTLIEERSPGFNVMIIRPATVCGYAKRLRLDLTVNILTNHAISNNLIKVFGGSQKRPNINIEDMTNLYLQSLEFSAGKIDGGIFNAGYENHSIKVIAEKVRSLVGTQIPIKIEPTEDLRSYHVCSNKISRDLGFVPSHSIEDAISSLVSAFKNGQIKNSMNNENYYNIKRMQNIDMK
ncbi:NAD-dependent epimerase/dehydratase family protein [Alphaproteobacteria bacterium]|nr:NAD-dependent epimerase/dehydratase family protein [Alphaproteobacteria bacterium]